MCFLMGVVLGVIVAALARIVRAELLLPKVLADLTDAVRTLHATTRHLELAIAQLREEWLAQQAHPTAPHNHHAMKGNKNGNGSTSAP
jgi:hypothetical protein